MSAVVGCISCRRRRRRSLSHPLLFIIYTYALHRDQDETSIQSRELHIIERHTRRRLAYHIYKKNNIEFHICAMCCVLVRNSPQRLNFKFLKNLRERERERDFKRERVVDIYIDEKTTKFKEEFCILTSILSQTDDDECSKTGWRFREIVLDVD